MKPVALLILLILNSLLSSAQRIQFQSSFEKAQKLSAETGKPMAILITTTPPAHVKDPYANLNDPRIVELINTNFINWQIDRLGEDAKNLIAKYNVSHFPSFLFIDSKGGIIMQRLALLPPPMLLLHIEEALSESRKESLVDLDKKYESGDRSYEFLRRYIDKRMKSGISDNADLVDVYIQNLKVSDFDNYNQVLFILKTGPLVDGKAYKLARLNQKVVDSIYKTELYDVRVAINNNIITNSMKSAVKAKNVNRAQATAQFAGSTWNTDYKEGYKVQERHMLNYYLAVKDTQNYLHRAPFYYDRHFMQISIDSIKNREQQNIAAARSRANEMAFNNRPPGGTVATITYAVPAATFATELNNGAYAVFETGTKNKKFLDKAIGWSKRSIELNEIPEFYDTLAHLHYQNGSFEEAIINQKKAIDLAKTLKRDDSSLKQRLAKMKNRQI